VEKHHRAGQAVDDNMAHAHCMLDTNKISDYATLNAFLLQLWLQKRSSIRRAQVEVGLINLCKGLFSLNARIYYKLRSGT
jgi:hypothetical protein